MQRFWRGHGRSGEERIRILSRVTRAVRPRNISIRPIRPLCPLVQVANDTIRPSRYPRSSCTRLSSCLRLQPPRTVIPTRLATLQLIGSFGPTSVRGHGSKLPVAAAPSLPFGPTSETQNSVEKPCRTLASSDDSSIPLSSVTAANERANPRASKRKKTYTETDAALPEG